MAISRSITVYREDDLQAEFTVADDGSMGVQVFKKNGSRIAFVPISAEDADELLEFLISTKAGT